MAEKTNQGEKFTTFVEKKSIGKVPISQAQIVPLEVPSKTQED